MGTSVAQFSFGRQEKTWRVGDPSKCTRIYLIQKLNAYCRRTHYSRTQENTTYILQRPLTALFLGTGLLKIDDPGCGLLCSSSMVLMMALDSRLFPFPNEPLHEGQFSLPFFNAIRQGEHVRWPAGQHGIGPSLGVVKHTGHSTSICHSSNNCLHFFYSSTDFL